MRLPESKDKAIRGPSRNSGQWNSNLAHLAFLQAACISCENAQPLYMHPHPKWDTSVAF